MKQTTSTALFVLLAPLLGACAKTTLTARQSVVPVLLGPVTSVGAPSAIPAGDQLGDFHSNSEALHSVESSTTTSGNTTYRTTTVRIETTATTVMDFDVMIATNDSIDRLVEVTSVTCDGYNFFPLVGWVAHATCSVDGRALLLRKPTVRPAPPAPTSPLPAPAAPPDLPSSEPPAAQPPPAGASTSADQAPADAAAQAPPTEAAPP